MPDSDRVDAATRVTDTIARPSARWHTTEYGYPKSPPGCTQSDARVPPKPCGSFGRLPWPKPMPPTLGRVLRLLLHSLRLLTRA